MGVRQGQDGQSYKGTTNLSPKSLYPNLVEDMQKNNEREERSNNIDLNLWRNEMKYNFK